MIASAALFTAMWAVVRQASVHVHPLEVTVFRFGFGLLFLLPWIVKVGPRGFATRRPLRHGINGLVQAVATAFSFTAVSFIPIATLTALSLTAPLFATAGAALFLGETVRARRWSATMAGFLGALIILRPGMEAMSTPALLGMAAAVFTAWGMLITKTLSNSEPPDTIALYLTVSMAVFSLPGAVIYWQAPPLEAYPWMALSGLFGTVGLRCMARAYQAADASLVMPFRYSNLIFATIIGFVFWGEFPDAWTWAGASVIVGAAFYTARREAQLARRRRPRAKKPMLIAWKDEYDTGHPLIDYDHRNLVNLTNTLWRDVEAGVDNVDIARTINVLVDYVRQHFEREEALFLASDYPDAENHIQKHREIAKVVADLAHLYERDPDSIKAQEIVEFLRRWLTGHILKTDMDYVPYLKE